MTVNCARRLLSAIPAILTKVGMTGIFILMLVAGGCARPDNEYAEYRNIGDEGWIYGDTLVFTPVHPDSLCRGILVAGIRHENSYPFTELWLEATYEDNGRRVTDTLSIHLADRYGKWTGKGIGASFQATDTIYTPFLHRSGSPVKLRHIMRADSLRGITQAGIFFLPISETDRN